MAIKVGINGFGRIGRMVLRAAVQSFPDLEIVGINDLLEPGYLAYMLQFDSVHGRFKGTVAVEGSTLVVNGKPIRLTAVKDPAELKWNEVGADVVIESTGLFLTQETAQKHITAGAKQVILSAPSKDDTPMFVYGVNHETYAGQAIISNASCTTNCLAPVAKVLNDKFGIQRGLMTTIHAYTMDQNLQDNVHTDLRRARAAAINMVPTTTGAAKAVALVIPELKGKFHGYAVRVPTPTVSMVDFAVLLNRPTSVEEINNAFREAAESEALEGILGISEEQLVSSDFIGTTFSSVVDLPLTHNMGDDFFKIISWYDNERGYSVRIADLTAYLVDHFE